MTHRTDDEVMGVRHLARRAAGFADNNMHAEVVNGMDVLAVRDAVAPGGGALPRRRGAGPDRGEHLPLLRPLALRPAQRVPDPRGGGGLAGRRPDRAPERPARRGRRRRRGRPWPRVEARVRERNARAAVRAVAGHRPRSRRRPRATCTRTRRRRGARRGTRAVVTLRRAPGRQARRRRRASATSDALREALVEEMARDARVILYGEDVADYGGAFKLTKGLLEAFGRERVFNTPISEAAICGTAVGAAMVGLRPVVELMYMDFALMASDQIANQAGEVALHERRPGGGAARHPRLGRRRQGLRRPALPVAREHLHPHPRARTSSTRPRAADAKGLLKSAIRTNNPVLFVREPGPVRRRKGVVPEERVPRARSARRASPARARDVTLVGLGPGRPRLPRGRRDARRPSTASRPRSSTCAASSRSTWRRSSPRSARPGAAWSPARRSSSAATSTRSWPGSSSRRSTTSTRPVGRIGAANGISPQAESLERAFLPNAGDIVRAVLALADSRRPIVDGPRRSACRSPAR